MIYPKGQEKTIEFFKRLVQKEKLGHADILKGDAGIGKKTLCDYLSHLIMCKTHCVCMECNGCLTTTSGANPDIVVVDNGDKASIGVSQIRAMISEVYVRPLISDKKIVIIKNAHLLTKGAQNALLKVIEEPPLYCVFFLLCDNINTILDTIISRTSIVNIYPMSVDTLKELFPDRQEFLYYYCQGNPGRLISMSMDDELKQKRENAFNALQSLGSDNSYDIYNFTTPLEESRDNANVIMDFMLMFVRDIVLTKQGLDTIVVNKDKIKDIKDLSLKISIEKCFKLTEIIGDLQKQLGKTGSLAMTSQIMLIKCREVIHDRCSRNQI